MVPYTHTHYKKSQQFKLHARTTKTLSNVKSQNHNLDANGDLVMFLTSKLIPSFIVGFALGMNPNELLIN